MRQLFDHQINDFNVDCVSVHALDEPDPDAGGACHQYSIGLGGGDPDVVGPFLQFQHGPVKEKGVNGISQEALLAVVLDRLRHFQRSKWACRENALAITHLETSLMWLHKRTLDRVRRGVEGTNAE